MPTTNYEVLLPLMDCKEEKEIVRFDISNVPLYLWETKSTSKLVEVADKVWNCSFILIEYILAHPQDFQGRRCLDVGSGTGIIGLYAALSIQSTFLVLTDYSERILSQLQQNIRLNSLESRVSVALLDLFQPISYVGPPLNGFDIFFAGDMWFVF